MKLSSRANAAVVSALVFSFLIGCTSAAPTSPPQPTVNLTAPPSPTNTPMPTVSPPATATPTLVPPNATPRPLSPCQQTVADVAALWIDYLFPEHLLEVDAVKTGEDFDVNAYFSVLDHLAMQPGYVLDYLYDYNGSGGSPVIYARSEDQDPYLTFSEFYADTIGDRTWEEWFEVSRVEYMDHIRVDDTEEGFFQYVVLRKMGTQFYLFWHANYNDDRIICDQSLLDELLADLAEPDFGLELSPELQDQARALDVEPRVEIGEDAVEVRVVIFTKWGGFIEERYTIARSFPHKVLEEETETLVPYDCGINF
jgi:hypothetical protein